MQRLDPISLKEDPLHASLLCLAGARRCALPIAHVAETMRPLPVEPLAGLPAYVSGVSIVRGAIVPVVNVAQMLGTTAPPLRFVIVKTGGGRVALAVDAVLGVRSIQGPSLNALPPLLQDANSEVIMALGVLDANLLFVLQTMQIIPEAVWADMESQRALG